MSKTTPIKFNDKPDHISEYLTHWTGRAKTQDEAFAILKKIIETAQLKFSYNLVSFPDNKSMTSNLMVCFTDTPIKYAKEHCKKYGYFGISFNKNKLIGCGANPVLYLMDNRREYQSYFLNFLMNSTTELNNEKKILVNWFASAGQPYNTKPYDINHFPEYFEREWRIAGRVFPYLWIESDEKYRGKYNEYEFDGEMQRQLTGNDEDFFLKFDEDIIENIIVPESFHLQAEQFLAEQKINSELILLTSQ